MLNSFDSLSVMLHHCYDCYYNNTNYNASNDSGTNGHVNNSNCKALSNTPHIYK